MVSFLPLDVSDEDSIELVLSTIDHAIQYGEDEEPKEPKDLNDPSEREVDAPDGDDGGDGGGGGDTEHSFQQYMDALSGDGGSDRSRDEKS